MQARIHKLTLQREPRNAAEFHVKLPEIQDRSSQSYAVGLCIKATTFQACDPATFYDSVQVVHTECASSNSHQFKLHDQNKHDC